MMKTCKILFICIVAIQLTTYAQDKKVALTTFWVSRYIGFEELGGSAAIATKIAAVCDNPNFDLKPVLDNFYKTFMNDYAQQFPFTFLPEEEVVGKPEYQAYESRYEVGKDVDRKEYFQRFMTPENYKPLLESIFKGEKSNQMQMVKMFGDVADGIMFVSMGYEFVKKMIPFTAGVRAYIKIKIWNKEGKRVLTVHETAVSKKSVAIVGGIPVMNIDKLLPLCESASESLVKDLNKRIKKIVKKVGRKM